jgi:hypothetical protein
MWVFSQSDGSLYRIFNIQPIRFNSVSKGYAGAGNGKNNPAMQNVRNVGPLPRGLYTIFSPIDSVKHGPTALPLVPDPKNDMMGRDDFMIHGDSTEAPGCASEGCIVMAKIVRELIWQSGDHDLTVIA